MRIAAVILVVVALGFAGVTFYFLQDYLADQRADVTVPVGAAVEVVVASRDLPAGKVLEPIHLQWQPWPDDTNFEGYIVQRDGVGKEQIEELVGSVVRRAIATGEPVSTGKVFKREQAGFLSGLLRPGMRAVSIKVSAVSGAAGFILPGDRVDVVLTSEWREKSEQLGNIVRRFSETILYDVRVLAIDQSLDDMDDSAQVSETATLEISPKQTEMLAVAGSMGRLSLSLRSLSPGPGDTYFGGSFTSDREVSLALGGRFAAAERRAEPPPARQPKKTATSKKRTSTVKVFRSSSASTREFTR